MRKQIFSLLLAAILAGGSLIGCGNGSTETTATNSDTGESVDTPDTAPVESETTREQIEDGLPEKDFGGRTFTLLTRLKYEDSFMPEELNGETVNDALYQRNVTVGERFNVKMQNVAPACEYGRQAL